MTLYPASRPAPAMNAVLLLFLLLAGANLLVFPPWDLPDERDHFFYSQWMLRHRALPPLYPDRCILEEPDAVRLSNNPPLFYLLIAPIVSGDLPSSSLVWKHRGDDRVGYDYTGPEEHRSGFEIRVHLIRLLGVSWTALAGLLLYHATRSLPGLPAAAPVLAAGLFLLNPKTIQFAGAVNPEGLGSAFSALLLSLLLLRMTSRSGSARLHGMLGLACGLSLLVRISLLPVVAAVFLFLLWEIWSEGMTRERMRNGVIALGCCLLIAGGWYLRNALHYGDPFGLKSLEQNWYPPVPPPRPVSLPLVPALLDLFAHSLGTFAEPLLVLAFSGIGLAGLYLTWTDARRIGSDAPVRNRLRLFAVLLSALGILFTLFVARYLRTSHAQGRYLLPALAPAALLATLSLPRLLPRSFPRAARILLFVLPLLSVISLARNFNFHHPPSQLPASSRPILPIIR